MEVDKAIATVEKLFQIITMSKFRYYAKRASKYYFDNGAFELGKLIVRRLRSGANRSIISSVVNESVSAITASQNKKITPHELMCNRFSSLRTLKTFPEPYSERKRISLITDSVNKGSLFGGVGTALIFAVHLANKSNSSLRIITRTEKSSGDKVEEFLSIYNLKIDNEINFYYDDFRDEKSEVNFFEDEIFITTSWWTTYATLGAVNNKNIIYILQEDERMFYPFGDDRLLAESVIRNKEIRYVINTRLLYNHFLEEGFENIKDNGFYFEPAFPPEIYFPRNIEEKKKKRFFFYARPNNPRNIFYFGVKIIDAAIKQGVIDPGEWEVFLIGKDLPLIEFSKNISVVQKDGLSWSEYAALAGTIDVALSLMYTPHPSYPPFDMAASGAIVVSNKFANKVDLGNYSKNILLAELSEEDILRKIRLAIIINSEIDKDEIINRNYFNSNWSQSFDSVVENLIR